MGGEAWGEAGERLNSWQKMGRLKTVTASKESFLGNKCSGGGCRGKRLMGNEGGVVFPYGHDAELQKQQMSVNEAMPRKEEPKTQTKEEGRERFKLIDEGKGRGHARSTRNKYISRETGKKKLDKFSTISTKNTKKENKKQKMMIWGGTSKKQGASAVQESKHSKTKTKKPFLRPARVKNFLDQHHNWGLRTKRRGKRPPGANPKNLVRKNRTFCENRSKRAMIRGAKRYKKEYLTACTRRKKKRSKHLKANPKKKFRRGVQKQQKVGRLEKKKKIKNRSQGNR